MWILLLLVVLLFFLSTRERFNPAMERPTAADASIVNTVAAYTGLSADKDMQKITNYITQLQSFYDDKYLPNKETPTPEQIKSFTDPIADADIDKAKLGQIIEYVFLSTTPAESETPTEEAPAPADTGLLEGQDTGGSSTTSAGPTTGSSNVSRRVWGPEYSGMGSGSGGLTAGDTTGNRQYPELIGPNNRDASTMYPGAGIGAPSKNWQLGMNGSLPSSASLGSDPNSQFLPYSRTPGDQDLIPNPYSVSNVTLPSTKTEPVPFLADFSAFQK
jgi:hypothetical protein